LYLSMTSATASFFGTRSGLFLSFQRLPDEFHLI
jgi:hypothetical protein